MQAMYGPAIQRVARRGDEALQLSSAASPDTSVGTVQRMLMTHQKKGDEGKQVESTGDKGFLNEYARWLAQDTSALVDGEPAGISGLLKTLKAGEIDGAAIAEALVGSLMGSGSWTELNDQDKTSMVAYVREEAGLLAMADDETLDEYIATNDFAGSWKDELAGWIRSKLTTLSDAGTIGAIGAIPEKWHADLAYLLYDATKTRYYAEELPEPYMPPFKTLIGDVNAGKVTRFDFVRKYGGAANQNWGAEFTVATPAPLKEKYEDKAVLHTHYPAADEAPNYAHTKPEEKKFEAGFGYTVVATAKVASIAATQDSWEDL